MMLRKACPPSTKDYRYMHYWLMVRNGRLAVAQREGSTQIFMLLWYQKMVNTDG